jgi:serine protease inhibitor
MKSNKLMILYLFFLILGLTACDQNSSDDPNPNPVRKEVSCTDAPGLCSLSQPNNTFGLQLFQALHEEQPDQNIFISPLSITSALTMTANGALGQTLEEMLQTLKIDQMALEDVNADYKNMLETLPGLDPEVKLSLANSIWYRQGYPVKEDFLKINEESFKSEVKELDFALPEAVDIINGWIEDKTEGLIQDMLDFIPGSAVMYLINAIYFKGSWLFEFKEENTFTGTFFLKDNSTIETDMMHHPEVGVPFLNQEDFQAVDLPYGDSLYSMMLFLPKEGATVDDIIEQMDQPTLEEWINGLQASNVEIVLPKFKMEYKQRLNDFLIAMGMPSAFTFSADFTNIADASLKISRVIHQSFVEVDEKGTEAAAATIVEMVESSAPSIPTLYFNKPFIFLIKERVGNNVLFIGKMMNPAE